MAYARGGGKKEATEVITNGVLFNRAANIHTNKEAPIPSIESKQRFQVYGKGVDRKTWIYIYPHQVEKKREKYARMLQYLYGPLRDDE